MGKVYLNPESLQGHNYDFIVVGGEFRARVSVTAASCRSQRETFVSALDAIHANLTQAGGLLAARLAENPTFKVLVIEAGLSDDAEGSNVLHMPFLAGRASGTPFDWNYTTTPQVGLNGRAVPLPRGLVVGGCSNTNSLVYIRGPAEDFDRIAKLSGDSGWAWASMTEYIQKNERHVAPWNHRNDAGEFDPSAHGYGPLQTSLTAVPTGLDRRVIETAKQSPEMFPFNLDLNSGNCLGVGWIHTTVGDGTRSSASTAFLNPALKTRDNIDLLIHTQVTRLLPAKQDSFDFRTVEMARSAEGPTFTLTAKNEVIICAGAIGTPQILQLSGIGPKDVLKRAGVQQIVDLPDVGQHFQDQPIIFCQWRANEPTLSSFLRDPSNISTAMAEYGSTKTGFAAGSAFFNTIAFLRVPADELPGMLNGKQDPAAGPNSAHFLCSFINTFTPNPDQAIPTEGDWISVALVVESPMSAGSVDIKTASAFDHPSINPGYFSADCPFDMATMITAFKTTQKFFAAQTWASYLGPPSPDTAALTSDAAIEAFVRKYATTIKHPVATARISKSGETGGVVGPDLLVKKVNGVRVVDASVLPFASAGFPQAQVYIIAERAAAMIKEKWANSA
uniref:Aryl-alcohol oxidase-like protein n=1 Tax=Mycena chlorophos TaxID=658473 RepID=A0ABQ0L946_MYCCL|nr:aryl-alcohol oxidase-like protein [Mycena chlorophos]